MSEGIGAVFAGWRTLLHISEWSGLSLGAVALLALLVWLDPRVLKPALIAAAAVALLYAGTLYGDATGRADVARQWDAARAAAEKAADERDAAVTQKLQQAYLPQLAALQAAAAANQKKADDYEQKLLPLLAKGPAKSSDSRTCELGDVYDQLHPGHGSGDVQRRRQPPRRHHS